MDFPVDIKNEPVWPEELCDDTTLKLEATHFENIKIEPLPSIKTEPEEANADLPKGEIEELHSDDYEIKGSPSNTCGREFRLSLEEDVKAPTIVRSDSNLEISSSLSAPQGTTELSLEENRTYNGVELCGPTAHLEIDKPFACEFCSKSFSRRRYVKQHMLIHSVGKVHECKLCGNAFSRRADLKRHMSKHTGERPHVCTYCSMAFAKPWNLKKHVFRHNGYKPHSCTFCSRAFSNKKSLSLHMNRADQLPHVCSICNKRFECRTGLEDHMSSHSDLKPYSCASCSKVFSQRSYLRRHVKRLTVDILASRGCINSPNQFCHMYGYVTGKLNKRRMLHLH
ncbi:zinc finger protein 383 [Anabrus simplex]|uniref:zinc finger protein 383 n=1 Tax=Anabrus simplex TaxID=316456 RepID=UPI0035A29BCF